VNFLITPQKVYRLVKQNRKLKPLTNQEVVRKLKPRTTTGCKCGGKNHSFAIICKWCNQILPARPLPGSLHLYKASPALSDETIAQLNSMYKGYSEP
jgi:hypothetical protein